jgi:hypothetical protein
LSDESFTASTPDNTVFVRVTVAGHTLGVQIEPGALRLSAHTLAERIMACNGRLLLAQDRTRRRRTASGVHRHRADRRRGAVPGRDNNRCLARNVDFLPVTETPIRPLIDDLNFIEDKKRWGYKFRFGVFKIDDHDLKLIRRAMTG